MEVGWFNRPVSPTLKITAQTLDGDGVFQLQSTLGISTFHLLFMSNISPGAARWCGVGIILCVQMVKMCVGGREG